MNMRVLLENKSGDKRSFRAHLFSGTSFLEIRPTSSGKLCYELTQSELKDFLAKKTIRDDKTEGFSITLI